MIILQLTFSLGSGGAERFVVDLSNELRDKSHEVYLVTVVDDSLNGNSHYKNFISDNVEYICLGNKSGFSYSSFLSVYRVIKELKPDVVHAHCNLLLLYFPCFFLNKSKYIHTLHNLADKCLKYNFLKKLQRWFYKSRVLPITISKSCMNSYRNLYKMNNDICIINGRSSFSNLSNNVANPVLNEIKHLKTKSNDKIFVHIARCHPQKNQQLLLNVFERLNLIDNSYKLIIVGSGFENANLNISDNLKDSISIVGEKTNVEDYLMCADFFILSSLWEGLPISLLEAMSLGVIPVCTPAGGIPDVIIDGKIGFLSPSFEEEDFFNTVKRAVNLEHTIDREKIISYYTENYSMKNCVNNYLDIYERY